MRRLVLIALLGSIAQLVDGTLVTDGVRTSTRRAVPVEDRELELVS
jgi:hypothetical protein